MRGDGTDALDGLRRAGVFHAKRVGVFTVDGYQGREADVVIVTLVGDDRMRCWMNDAHDAHICGFGSIPTRTKYTKL